MNKINFVFHNENLSVNLRDEADESVFNEIFKHREYRAAEQTISGAKDWIVDIGAHAGFFSLFCHVLNPKAKILTLEPEPTNFIALENHLKINHAENISAEKGALAGATGTRFLKLMPDNHNHRLMVPGAKGDAGSISTECYSLADLLKKYKIIKVALLKMDIEGGEAEVFAGLTAADFGMVKSVILEYHNNRDSRKIENKLRENGFGVQIFPSHFDKTMGFLFANNKRIQ